MSIEEKLHQHHFKNSYQKLALNILYTSNNLNAFLKTWLKKEELTLQQYNILRILRGSRPYPLSTLQIRERMMDRKSDTSRIVDRMVNKHLVSKKISAVDNRLVDVQIADYGLQKLDNLDNTEEHLLSFFNTISEESAEQISLMLDLIHTNNAIFF